MTGKFCKWFAQVGDWVVRDVEFTHLRICKFINCDTTLRFAFLADSNDNSIYVSEINAILSFTQSSMNPKLQETSVPFNPVLDGRRVQLAPERKQAQGRMIGLYGGQV
ncbi:MAG TPA: hypothetical protein VKF38_15985 [Anaerolineaceae bacterium]|nr:hypothetical protein [Anaerolineaceae bacterium]